MAIPPVELLLSRGSMADSSITSSCERASVDWLEKQLQFRLEKEADKLINKGKRTFDPGDTIEIPWPGFNWGESQARIFQATFDRFKRAGWLTVYFKDQTFTFIA